MNAFHRAYWGDWKFSVGAHDKENMSFSFDRGGFQEARGSCGRGGHDWFIENVKELTDRPEEWYLDVQEGMLYHYPNNSAQSGLNYVASRMATLISINGSMVAPVRDIYISGLALAHASPTFMDDYEVRTVPAKAPRAMSLVYLRLCYFVPLQSYDGSRLESYFSIHKWPVFCP